MAAMALAAVAVVQVVVVAVAEVAVEGVAPLRIALPPLTTVPARRYPTCPTTIGAKQANPMDSQPTASFPECSVHAACFDRTLAIASGLTEAWPTSRR